MLAEGLVGVDDAQVLCGAALRVRASNGPCPATKTMSPAQGASRAGGTYEDSNLEVELDGALEDARAFAGG
jgi:hypothetical protein